MIDIEFFNKRRWLSIVRYPWLTLTIIFITLCALFFMYRSYNSDLSIYLKYKDLMIKNNQILINYDYNIKNISKKSITLELKNGIKYKGIIKKSVPGNLVIIINENSNLKYSDYNSICKITICSLKLFEWLNLKKIGVKNYE